MIASTRFRRNGAAGTTLLEVLIALAVMGFLALAAMRSLTAVIGYLARGDLADARVAVVLDRTALRTVIERAVSHAGRDGSGVAVTGTAQAVLVAAVLDDGTFWPGEPARLALGPETRGDQAAIAARIEGMSDSDQKPVLRLLTLSGPSGRLRIDYFGQRAPDQPAIWSADWPPDLGMPRLIRLHISDGSGTYPPLIIRPGKAYAQSEMSLSSLLPPSLPSRP